MRVELRGLDSVLATLRAKAASIRATSAGGVEIAPAASDVPKAAALVRHGRNVFEVDDAMRAELVDTAREFIEGQRGRGRAWVAAALWKRIGDRAREIIRGRIDDTEPTPGGKAALRRPRRDGSTDHIGRDTGALYQGLVVRLIGR